MLSLKKISIALSFSFHFIAIMISCSHQQIIPSTDTKRYANTIIDSEDVYDKDSLSNLLGPTSFPSGMGYRDVSLGDGWVIVDMGKNEEVIDNPGPDLRIYESDQRFNPNWKSEPYMVYVSNDNERWYSLGYGRGIKEFDIAKTNLKKARYVKIKGYTKGPSSNPGPDIEAIESLHPRNMKQELATTVIDEKDEPTEASIALRDDLDLDFGKYYAVVIGNNEYQFMPKLKTAISDAQVIAEILHSRYGFEVEKLYNATREDILRALHQYRRKLNFQDNLLIYYAGHGWLDEVGDEGYWLPVDAEKDIETNWISNSHITTTLRAMAAKHVIVVADSCYSGKLTRGVNIKNRASDYLIRIAKKKSRTVLSSGGLEPVLDSGGKGNHSVFASAFIDALTENDDIMDGTQFFAEIRRTVMLNSHQTPEYADIRHAGHDGGDFLFVPFESRE